MGSGRYLANHFVIMRARPTGEHHNSLLPCIRGVLSYYFDVHAARAFGVLTHAAPHIRPTKVLLRVHRGRATSTIASSKVAPLEKKKQAKKHTALAAELE